MFKFIFMASLFFFPIALKVNGEEKLSDDIEGVNISTEVNEESNNLSNIDVVSENTVNINKDQTQLIKVNPLEAELLEREEKERLKKEAYYKMLRESTIFHTAEELDRLDDALQALEVGAEVIVDILDVDENKEKETIKTSNIVFYLDSIMYHDNKDWVIWLNGSKITPELNKTDLKILYINRSMVQFRWITGYKKFVNAIANSIEDGNLPVQTSMISG